MFEIKNIDQYRKNTANHKPIGAGRKCTLCGEFRGQLGSKVLKSPSKRLKRWACGICVSKGIAK